MLNKELAVPSSVRGGGSGPGVPPQLEQVAGGADELPFSVASTQPPPGEPSGVPDAFDVSEHWLNGVGPLGVERSSLFGRERGVHGPSAGSFEDASARDRSSTLVALVGRGDEELGAPRLGRRQVGLAW
jgi:hypothetical protein